MSDLSASPFANTWAEAMDTVAEDDGYLEPLGKDHLAFFAEAGTTLLVTFEGAEAIRARADKMPAAWAIAKENGWSLLTIIAEGQTFWRDHHVWGYFDRLVDDAFFDDFDQVLFYGVGPGGYAAAAYMVAAPGASALLVSPLATLDPSIIGWDGRYKDLRGRDFTSRYGYAPDMTEGAKQVWILRDPAYAPDAAHAALFRKPYVTLLNMRHLGEGCEPVLNQARNLEQLLGAAAGGRLDESYFARFWRRARRNSSFYLRQLTLLLQEAKRPRLEQMLCTSVTSRMKAPRYARRLVELNALLTPAPPEAETGAPLDPLTEAAQNGTVAPPKETTAEAIVETPVETSVETSAETSVEAITETPRPTEPPTS